MYGFDPRKYGIASKPQEQFASFAPQQVEITPASFPQAPLTGQQDTPSQAPQIPQQAMQTYAPEVSNPSTNYKAISKEDEAKLMKMAGGNKAKADALYPRLLQHKNDQLFLKNRREMLQDALVEATQGTDKQKKEATLQMVKIAQFTDFIREDASKKGAIGVSNKSDDEIMQQLIAKSPIGQDRAQKELEMYINDKSDIETTLNNIYGKNVQPVQEEGMSTLGRIGVGALGVVGTLVGGKVGGEIAKSVGKKVYGLTLPPTSQEAGAIQAYEAGRTNIKPKTTIDTALSKPLFTKGNKRLTSLTDKFGLFGTRSQIGVQAEAIANNMFQEKISPIFKQSIDEGLTINYEDLFNKAKESVQNNKKRSVEQKTAILDDIAEIQQEYKGTTTLENLDLAKRDIANKLPAKYFKGAPMTNTVKDAQGTISNVFRNTVHDTIKSKYGVDSAKIYSQYADLKGLGAMGQKAMTQAGLQAGAGTFLSTTAQELATPVTTTVGKLTYKLGELLTKPTDYLVNKAKELIKSGKIKNVLKLAPGTMAGATSPDINELRDDFHSTVVSDAKEAISLIEKGEAVPVTNTAYLLGDKLPKEEKIKKLNKIVNSKAPKRIVTPFEFLIDKIF